MSHYAEYMKERLGIETIETDQGFISYRKEGDDLFVHEYYVAKDHRGTRAAWVLYKNVMAVANEMGCARIMGRVWPGVPNSEHALVIALKCGFKLIKVTDGSVTYAKELREA